MAVIKSLFQFVFVFYYIQNNYFFVNSSHILDFIIKRTSGLGRQHGPSGYNQNKYVHVGISAGYNSGSSNNENNQYGSSSYSNENNKHGSSSYSNENNKHGSSSSNNENNQYGSSSYNNENNKYGSSSYNSGGDSYNKGGSYNSGDSSNSYNSNSENTNQYVPTYSPNIVPPPSPEAPYIPPAPQEPVVPLDSDSSASIDHKRHIDSGSSQNTNVDTSTIINTQSGDTSGAFNIDYRLGQGHHGGGGGGGHHGGGGGGGHHGGGRPQDHHKGPIINREKLQSEEGQNIADQCSRRKDIRCESEARYRTMDGTCNNLRKPWWGSANTPHVRLLRAYYSDGKSTPRRSIVDDDELPSPRLLSVSFLEDKNITDIHTRMYLEFSQLVAHDVTLNGQDQEPHKKCCSANGDRLITKTGNCRPISVPPTDPFYFQFGRSCLEYKQSISMKHCHLDIFQPNVGSTHFIDASFIYGSSEDKAHELRSHRRGQLRVNPASRKGYLPHTASKSSCGSTVKNCYDSGDVRVNQNLDLAVSQNVFLRFHNYIAEQLIEENPRWETNDETVYQEARRIVIAIFQHIIYKDWLPILIGKHYAKDFGLAPLKSGYFEGYDDRLNPSTLADFSGGAFRSLHSLIPSHINLVSKQGDVKYRIPYSATLQRAGDFMQDEDNYDSTIRGMLTQSQSKQDSSITEQMTNNFIDGDVPQSGTGRFGDDLSSRDIQRGRNFGLRPYTFYRELCGLSPVREFNDLYGTMDERQIQKLSAIYQSAEDIDFYVGGLLEYGASETITTPSFRCVIAEAFYRYKYGDRYFYESSSNPGDFTPRQLKVIRSVILGTILCIGGDDLDEVQENVFYPASEVNPMIPCLRLTDIDFSSFKSVSRSDED